jgi:hypothetical protein
LENFGKNTTWADERRSWQFFGAELPEWSLFALGAGVALAAIYFTTIRPTLVQLSELQAQVSSLETSVERLAGQGDVVARTNSLLGQMAEQGRRNVDAARALVVVEQMGQLQDSLLENAERGQSAADALESLESLQTRLADQRYATENSHQALDQLDRLRNRLIAAQAQAWTAGASLDDIDALQNRLIGQRESVPVAAETLGALVDLTRTAIEQTSDLSTARFALEGLVGLRQSLASDNTDLQRAREVVRAWSETQAQLTAAASHAADARRTSDELLGMADDLVCRGDTARAASALDGLANLRERLDDQGTGIDLAHQRVDQLIDLKDRAVSQTRDLADATANLELMTDVQDQLGKIALSFGRMRHWIVEILAFEPAFNRAMRTLQPLSDLGNLRHMSATDLRQVIRSLNDRREIPWTGPQDALSTIESTAPTPAVDESARAN